MVHGPRDHPRSRGEYLIEQTTEHSTGGSSPLSRGILAASVLASGGVRIIPALAGNTPRLRPLQQCSSDHPRSRGEYSLTRFTPTLRRGSSPLSRGILLRIVCLFGARRIIPALAGNTRYRAQPDVRAKDHPRSRGEYYMSALRAVGGSGSSPLSRGIRSGLCVDDFDCGIIPALAGNTLSTAHEPHWPPDHPRSRGEYLID